MRIAVMDIETTGLAAVGSGTLLCAVVKPYRGAPVVFRVDEIAHCSIGDEGELIDALAEHLSQFHAVVGHNIRNFDWPYLKSRARVLGRAWIRPPLHYDTMHGMRRAKWRTTLNGLGKPTAALSHAIDFIGARQEKTAIYPREWWESVWGVPTEAGKRKSKKQLEDERRAALDYIVDHCKKDVRMNELVYEALLEDDEKASFTRIA